MYNYGVWSSVRGGDAWLDNIHGSLPGVGGHQIDRTCITALRVGKHGRHNAVFAACIYEPSLAEPLSPFPSHTLGPLIVYLKPKTPLLQGTPILQLSFDKGGLEKGLGKVLTSGTMHIDIVRACTMQRSLLLSIAVKSAARAQLSMPPCVQAVCMREGPSLVSQST